MKIPIMIENFYQQKEELNCLILMEFLPKNRERM
jgi:hypothetical protein